MTDMSGKKRTDTASIVIKASPQAIYQAFLDAEAMASWRPPEGMNARIFAFEPRVGGSFRMSFGYADTAQPGHGKTSEHADVFQGKFLEMVPGERIVEQVEFDTDDPAFMGAMTITTTLAPVPGGTEVTIICEDVPVGIRPEDHYEGMMSTLKNLAAFTE